MSNENQVLVFVKYGYFFFFILLLDPDDPSTNTSNPCTNYQLSSDSPQPVVDCTASLTSVDLGKHTFLHGDW